VFVMEELIQHFILEPMSEPIKLYILPALSSLPSFPYKHFVQTIQTNIKKNIRYVSLTKDYGMPRESKMPFSLSELVSMSTVFKGVVLGLIELAYPDSRSKDTYTHSSSLSYTNTKSKNMVAMWCHLFKALVSLLR
ncbi:ubiquitin-protein ligase E3C-like, partial [Diaphorina citri]|uniref:Ubiquitin-protein ligase E3C-like n=1 Tax=Diaphorina citri TaxID=121845 RepID=A0A1S3DQ05_DIACI